MPIPSPKKGESQDKFMGRCMSFINAEEEHKPEGKRRPQKQRVAICFSSWREMHGGKAPESTSEQTEEKKD